MNKKIKIQIKSVFGKVLFEYECIDNSIKKTLEKAINKSANLHSADLHSADLRYADLHSADLRYADLRYADLQSAKNLIKSYQGLLSILKNQKNKLIAYKYLNGNISPYQDFKYEIGKTYEVKEFDTDEFNECGKGLNVATLEWCLKDTNFSLDKTYIEIEFDPKDIVAIPYFTDGKFRVKKLKVIKKVPKKQLKELLKPMT